MEILHLLRLPGVPHVGRGAAGAGVSETMGGGAGVASGAEGKEANGGGAAACRRRKEGMTNGEREREEDHRLCSGWTEEESLEDVGEKKRRRRERERGSGRLTSCFFNSLPPFHPSFLPSVFSLLDCSFGQTKTFLFSAGRRKTIISLFPPVREPRVTPPPHAPLPISHPFTPSVHQL